MRKGSLRILNLDGKMYDGIQVHRPWGKCSYSRTQNGFTRQRSKMLSFHLLSHHDVWAEILEIDLARAQDMSFYFFPGDSEGHEKQYCSLLNLLENEDLAMRSCMNDVVELLLFHSKQLCYGQGVDAVAMAASGKDVSHKAVPIAEDYAK